MFIFGKDRGRQEYKCELAPMGKLMWLERALKTLLNFRDFVFLAPYLVSGLWTLLMWEKVGFSDPPNFLAGNIFKRDLFSA